MAKKRPSIVNAASSPCPADYGLREFVMFVTDMTDVKALDPRLTKEERELLHRHGELFSTAVAELEKALTEGQLDHVQEYRQHKLWEALGSACVIASNRVKGLVNERMRVAEATEERKRKSREWRRKWQDDAELLAAKAWRADRDYPAFHPFKIARLIEDEVGEKSDTIARHLRKYEARVKSFG